MILHRVGSQGGILEDDDGEAWDVETGWPARRIPDICNEHFTMVGCWEIRKPEDTTEPQ